MPALDSVVASLLTVVCGVVALATLGLAAARVAGGPDDDVRAAGRRLIPHGVAVLALVGCVLAVGEPLTAFGRAVCALLFGAWGTGAIAVGVVLSRRPERADPPDEDEGGGGGGPRDEPDPPPPPWWPDFERDLAAWQAERERERVPAHR